MEVYLKDDPALEDCLFNAAIDDGAVFETYDGTRWPEPISRRVRSGAHMKANFPYRTVCSQRCG